MLFCQLKLEGAQADVKCVQLRKIKSIDPDQFSAAIRSSQLYHEQLDDLDSLVSRYNGT